MRSFLIAVNSLLIIAVIFLYIKVFKNTTNLKTNTSSNVTSKTSVGLKNASIAFVELDSLNEKIDFIKDRRKELEIEQKAIEVEWQTATEG